MSIQIDLNNPKSVELGNIYFKTISEQQDKEFFWIKKLRSEGVKGAFPKNSYDKESKKLTLYFARFNDGVLIGDKIAIGDADDYFLVEILGLDEDSWVESYFVKELN